MGRRDWSRRIAQRQIVERRQRCLGHIRVGRHLFLAFEIANAFSTLLLKLKNGVEQASFCVAAGLGVLHLLDFGIDGKQAQRPSLESGAVLLGRL